MMEKIGQFIDLYLPLLLPWMIDLVIVGIVILCLAVVYYNY